MKLMVLVCILITGFGVGCAALSHYVTPTEVNQKAVEYVVNHGGGHIEDYQSWFWPNLVDAARLDEDLDITHDRLQLEYRQYIESDNQYYTALKGVSTSNISAGLKREESLFGERGLLSMGLALLGVGGCSGLIGLARKRPGDVTQAQLNEALDAATMDLESDVWDKKKQLLQVIQGVQEFINTFKDSEDDTETSMVSALKEMCDKAQDTGTQIAVAAAKKTLMI